MQFWKMGVKCRYLKQCKESETIRIHFSSSPLLSSGHCESGDARSELYGAIAAWHSGARDGEHHPMLFPNRAR